MQSPGWERSQVEPEVVSEGNNWHDDYSNSADLPTFDTIEEESELMCDEEDDSLYHLINGTEEHTGFDDEDVLEADDSIDQVTIPSTELDPTNISQSDKLVPITNDNANDPAGEHQEAMEQDDIEGAESINRNEGQANQALFILLPKERHQLRYRYFLLLHLSDLITDCHCYQYVD